MSVYVVKRTDKKTEGFDPLKLHSSIVSACLAVRALEGEAHTTAERVCKSVIDWLETKAEITSADIRRVAAASLQAYHPEAAYIYEHHRLVI